MYPWSGDGGADRLLRPVEADLEDPSGPPDERKRSAVLARRLGGDLRDPGGAGVVEEHPCQRRADAAVLVAVGDDERDLGRLATRAHELGEPRGLWVAGDRRDEGVVLAVDSRKLLEVAAGEARLGGVEPAAPRLRPEPVEDGGHGGHVACRERADEDGESVREVEGAGLHGGLEKPTL